MVTRITVLHNEDRLAGTLVHLNRGSNAPRIRVFGGTRPGDDVPTGSHPHLCTITLIDPPGSITPGSNQLVLALPPDALILADGTATWAIIENGTPAPSMAIDVSDAAGSGELKMQTTTLLAGGATRLISAIIS